MRARQVVLALLVAGCGSSRGPGADRPADGPSATADASAAIDAAGIPGDTGAGEIGPLPRLDALPAQPDLPASADTGPLSCEQRLLDLNKTHMKALACMPQSPAACKSAVEGLCGCQWGVGDPASAETLAFIEAVRAYKSAGCVAPCPDGGACPATSGFCSSPGQARPPTFSCSY